MGINSLSIRSFLTASHKNLLITFVLVLQSFLIQPSHAQGSAITLQSSSYFGSNYQISACPPINCVLFLNDANHYGAYTSSYDGSYRYGNYSKISAVTYTVDYFFDFFLVPYSEEFSASTISSGQFVPLALTTGTYPQNLNTLTLPFGNFYLGVAVNQSDYVTPANYQAFGWVELRAGSSGLTMIDNAGWGAKGIYVGTTETVPVPEPKSFAMIVAGLVLVGFVARKKKQPPT